MDFVIEVLTRFFTMDMASAEGVMMSVHEQGQGVCGIYSKEVAEMKVMQVNSYSRDNKHPLQCQMEVV